MPESRIRITAVASNARRAAIETTLQVEILSDTNGAANSIAQQLGEQVESGTLVEGIQTEDDTIGFVALAGVLSAPSVQDSGSDEEKGSSSGSGGVVVIGAAVAGVAVVALVIGIVIYRRRVSNQHVPLQKARPTSLRSAAGGHTMTAYSNPQYEAAELQGPPQLYEDAVPSSSTDAHYESPDFTK